MKRSEVTSAEGRLMVLSDRERRMVDKHRRNLYAFRRLAHEVAIAIYRREYQRAMDAAKGAVAGVAAAVGPGRRGKRKPAREPSHVHGERDDGEG